MHCRLLVNAVIDLQISVQDMNVKKEGEIQILTRKFEQTKSFRDFLEAGTFSQFQAVIQDALAASVNQYEDTPLSPLVLSLAPPTLQPQLKIRPGTSGGILT